MMRGLGSIFLGVLLTVAGCDDSDSPKLAAGNGGQGGGVAASDTGIHRDAGIRDAYDPGPTMGGAGGGQWGAGGAGGGQWGAGGAGGGQWGAGGMGPGDDMDEEGAGGMGPGDAMDEPIGNTNVNLGGSQDLGHFRRMLADGRVPTSDDFEAGGFFAEHHTPLPVPDCGNRICIQAMLGVMGNLINGANCTLLQIGLNSPIVADPNNRPGLNLVVVVDTSGSMAEGGKIDFVRRGLTQMVASLNDADRIALVTYNTDAHIALDMQALEGRRADVLAAIRQLEPAGSTNLFEGLETGYGTALRHYDSGRQNRVILLSDGQPTAGETSLDAIMAMSRTFNSEGVGLTTVGLGSSFNYQLMRGLAEQGDGNYYFVEDVAAVDEVFAQELSYFTVPVAFDLELELRAGTDYRFVRAEGSTFWEDTPDGSGGGLNVPSVFLAHRVSHDDVEPGGGRRGGGSALMIEMMPTAEPDARAMGESRVAEIIARFREPGSDEVIEAQVPVQYPGLPWQLREEGYFDNTIVEKSFVMLNIYAALVSSVETFHLERQPDLAVGILRRVIAAVADYEDSANGGMGDVDMQFDIELMEQLIQVMLANGAQEPEEFEYPEDPWPAD